MAFPPKKGGDSEKKPAPFSSKKKDDKEEVKKGKGPFDDEDDDDGENDFGASDDADEEDDDDIPFGEEPGENGGFLSPDQVEAQKEAGEAEDEAAQEFEETKKKRAQANAEVADALGKNLNDGPDEVEFYPSIISFSAFKDKEGKDGKGKDEDGDEEEEIDQDEEQSEDDEEEDESPFDDEDSDDEEEDEESDDEGDDEEETPKDDKEEDPEDEDEPADDEKKPVKKDDKKKVVNESVDDLFRLNQPKKKISRWMVKCPYCKETFAVEAINGRSPWQLQPADALNLVEKHIKTCPKTETRLRHRITPWRSEQDLPAYHNADIRARHAHDIITTDWKITQVTGVYNPNVKCSAKCQSSKGPSCECACGGANHGGGRIL